MDKGYLNMSLPKIITLRASCCLVLVFFISSPVFSAVPKSKIDSVLNVSCASVDVLGAINPRGLDTSYRFDCLSSDGSFFSVWFNLSAGSDYVDVQYTFKDLKQKTEYRVNIYAYNSDGCDFSNKKTFITKKCGVRILKWQEIY